MGIVQAVKQFKELIYVMTRLLTTIASYLTVSKSSLIYKQEQIRIILISIWSRYYPSHLKICYRTIKETDKIETEESSEIHLILNQPPNQLQHNYQLQRQKRANLSRFLKPTGKKETFLQIKFF